MSTELSGMRIAILVTDGFEQVEMTGPREALDAAGAQTVVISPGSDRVQGMNHHDKADTFAVDQKLEEANPSDFDALRMNPQAVEFVKSFFDAHKPVAAICHGPCSKRRRHVGRPRAHVQKRRREPNSPR